MMASASLTSTPPRQIHFPTAAPPTPPNVPMSIIRPSVTANSVHENCGATRSSVIIRSPNCHTNYNHQLLHDHNYAALPPTSTAAYFGIKPIGQQKCNSQCDSTSCTPACVSTNCHGILRTTLSSTSPTSTKYQLNLQLNVLKCEIERLNEKLNLQTDQLEKLKEDNCLQRIELSEQLERLYVQENRLDEKKVKLGEELNEKTELQERFNRFRESVVKLSCGVILLIGELKKDYFNCKGGSEPVKRNGINGKVSQEEDDGLVNSENEDNYNYKWKLGSELDKISELVKDNLRAWVFVDQVVEEEEVRMMRERLSRNKGKEEDGRKGEGEEVYHQVVVQEVEVVVEEEEKENLSVVSGGDEDGEEENEGERSNDKWVPEEDEREEEMEVLDDKVEEDESENEGDLLKVSEMSSQQKSDRNEEGERRPSTDSVPVSKVVQIEPVKFRCGLCPSLSMRFEEIGDMKRHLKEVHRNKQWRNARGCKRCGMVFVGVGQLQKHRLSEHSKSKVASKKKVKPGVQEEAVQGSSKRRISRTSEIPDSLASTSTAPANLSTAPEPQSSSHHWKSLPKLKPVTVVISDVMVARKKVKDDETFEKTERPNRSRRSSSLSTTTTRSRTSSTSPPPPVLQKMTKSIRKNGSNNSLASSSVSEMSYDSLTPPVLDLEVELEVEKAEETEEELEPPKSEPPLPPIAVPVVEMVPVPQVAPGVEVLTVPEAEEVPVEEMVTVPEVPPSPPPEKQKNEKKIMGHATDLRRRHLGVFCICGKQFIRQSKLDKHIRLKATPIHIGRAFYRRHRSTSTTNKVARERPVKKVKRIKSEASSSVTPAIPFSTKTRRSSVIAAVAASAAPVPVGVPISLITPTVVPEDPIPSTSASALASVSASIPKKEVTPTTTTNAVPIKVKPKKMRKKVSHGLHPCKPLHCKCGFKAPLFTFLKNHVEFYKPDRKFACQICHQIFVSVRYLSHHYTTCHKVSQNHTDELITARGQVGKLMNCYVKIQKKSPAQRKESFDKTDDETSPRQLPWRPIFKKKLKKLRFTKRKERFICKWCQRHFPFVQKLTRHLSLNMQCCCEGGNSVTVISKVGGAGGGGGGPLNKMLYACKPCEKIFYNQVEFLRHKAVFHRCSSSLGKFITVQKEINASIAAAAAAELSNDLSFSAGIKTRRGRRPSRSTSFSLSSSRTAVAVAPTSVQASTSRGLSLGRSKSPRKRSFVSKTQTQQQQQQKRRSLSSSPSRNSNSKCLCNGDSTSPCNVFKGKGNKKRGKKRSFQCSKCQRVFTCPAYLRRHMGEKHNINCVIPKPCQRCGKVFPTASQLKKHTETAHNKLKKPVTKQQRDSTPPPQRRSSSSSPSRVPGSPVGPHRQMVGGGNRFKCVCGSLFSLKSQLFKHIQEKNQEKGKLLSCTLCPKEFAGHVHLKIHMFRVHQVRSESSRIKIQSKKKKVDIWCKTCGKVFDTDRKRIWHESRVHKLKKSKVK